MKKTLLVSGVVLSVAAMTGCTDDTPEKVVPIEKGTEIKFGAHLESELRSRTYYGDEANDPTSTAWPIYWNGSDNPDHIFVYSPQALSTRNQADYTVNADTQEPSKATDLVKDGAFGVQTGPDETPYDFYAMYPSSAVKGQITAPSTVINATLSAEQTAVFAGTDGTPTTLPSAVKTGEINYIMNPDMTNCLMTAATTGVDLATTQAVTLQFMPFASVLDILITGPVDNNTVTERDQCAVTSVMIEAPEGVYIAGDFSYDFSKTDMSEALTFGENKSNSITVSTLGTDADGNMTGVPLVNENTLRVKAFLLPNPALKNNGLTITVMTSDAQVWKKTIPASAMNTFEPKQIHRVKLPALKFAEAKFDYSRWISQLDPRIYLSEISLPGTTSSFSWKLLESSEQATKDKAMQSITVPEQFKAGARVFRCHVWLYGNVTGVDGQTPGFGINVNGETYVRPLGEVIEQLYNIMKTSHSDEFCVIMISDFKQTNLGNGISGTRDPWNNDNGKTFYERFQKISQHWKDMGWTPDHIDANTTIGDVKGKIIVKLQLNGNGNINDPESNYHGATDDMNYPTNLSANGSTNALLTKIDGWQAVNGCDALLNWWTAMNGNKIFYAPMAYGTVGTYTTTAFTNNSNGRGTVTVTTPGIGSQAAEMVVKSAEFVDRPIVFDYWRYANCNVTTPPANFHDPNQLWYVYGAQASPSNRSEYDNAYDMITDIVNTIKTHYKTGGQTIHNKFFMTYLGGAGSYRTKDQITQAFVPQWKSLTSEANFGKNRPFGWVLFNEIQSADYKIPDGTPENSTDVKVLVTRGIQRVISRNNDLDFKLQRRKDPVTPAAAPSGDVKGTQSGGSLFK